MNRIQLSNLAIAMSVGAALIACGGGGGSNSSASSNSGTPGSGTSSGSSSTTPTSGTLLTSSPTPTYAAGSDRLSVYTFLQTARLAAGAGALTQNAQIDTAASAHAMYLWDNFSKGLTHVEDPTLAGYYATTLTDRLTKAGAQYAMSGEVVGGLEQNVATGADCIAHVLDTVYHLAIELRPMTEVGIGTYSTTAGGLQVQICVVDTATAITNSAGQFPASGAVVGYPYPGQANVPATFQPAGETPRVPTTAVPNQIAGAPVGVSLHNADYENLLEAGKLVPTLTAFSLKDASGNLVPAAIIADPAIQAGAGVTLTADSTGDIGTGEAVLVPLAALNVNSTYTVTVSATLQAGGTPLAKTWSFTTGTNTAW